jgi:hypothetical protein
MSRPDESAWLMIRVPRELGERLRAVFVESHADEPAEQWGFSATAIDEGDHADGITRVVILKTKPRQLATGGR